MTVLYSSDFESASTGDQSEWPALGGATRLQVLTATGPGTPARGTKGIGRNNDGDSSYWNGSTSLTDMAMRSAQKLNTGMGSHICHLHRANAASSDAYVRFRVNLTSSTATAIIDVRNGGGGASATAAGSLSISAGDTLHMESSSVGTLHSFRIWKNAEARPASAAVTLTDATFSSGAAGLRKVGSFEITLTDDVVITDAAGGEDTFYPPLPTISVQPGAQSVTAGATATFSVTAANATSYQWQRSTNSGGSWADVTTGTGGTTASYTTAATTVTGGSANNADEYRVNVINAAGTVTSSAALLTVNAAPASATTLTGPGGGTVGSPSAAFTVGANGTITGTVTVTPSDGGGGGTFSPTSVAISSGTPTATFTYTAGSIGAKTISISDTGSLTDATPLTYTATLTAGTLTSSPLKNNTGTVLAAVAFEAYVSNPTTGALVVKKTGLTSNGSGVITFSDGAVVAATSYRVVWKRTDTGAEGLETLTAT